MTTRSASLPAAGTEGPPALPAPEASDAPSISVRHRDLPVVQPGEFDRMVGFVRIVRLLGGMLGTLGVLAAVAGITLGLPALAIGATVLTTLILYALWEDTRLATALELLRRRRLAEGEAALVAIARSGRRSLWQRQRARTYLASLAWHRGDPDSALRWLQARLAVPRRGREDPGDRWLAEASEVQLLAVTGQIYEAAVALDMLAPPPPDPYAELLRVQLALLIAFVRDDADMVRDEIDAWEPIICERDGIGVGVALLAWANAGRGALDRAMMLVRVTREHGDREHLERYYPRLWQWIERYRDMFHYARR